MKWIKELAINLLMAIGAITMAIIVMLALNVIGG